MTIRNVTAPIDKIRELILQEYPNYYELNHIRKRDIVAQFVKPIDAQEMYEYMEEDKDTKES
jgi:hypothetical protein